MSATYHFGLSASMNSATKYPRRRHVPRYISVPADEHMRLLLESKGVKRGCPESARALTEYGDLPADRCAYLSGLRE